MPDDADKDPEFHALERERIAVYEQGIMKSRRDSRIGEDLTQKIRILDVAVIGPLMIYAGMKAGELPAPARAALVLFGVTTMGYNAYNLFEVEKQHDRDDELFSRLEAEIKAEEKA